MAKVIWTRILFRGFVAIQHSKARKMEVAEERLETFVGYLTTMWTELLSDVNKKATVETTTKQFKCT
jgi:hypothetical protein